MSRLQSAVSVATVVLATLLISALGYSGMASQLRHQVAIQQPTAHPLPPATPLPTPVLPSPTHAPTGPYAIDQDMLDASTGWMLVSDCPERANATCSNWVVKTTDGGQSWTTPVQVGPAIAPTDGDAPRVIRFLNSQDGFVYGHSSAFVTHDSGKTWHTTGVTAVFVNSLAMSGGMVWLSTYPCAKGTLCQSETRSSSDGGKTWSAARKLPLNFLPDDAAAFPKGVLLGGSATELQMTTDRGATWQIVRSPCPQATTFHGTTTTPDGVELWSTCLAYPDASGQITSESLYVSEDAGKTWAKRNLGTLLPGWLVTSVRHVALISTNGYTTLVTHDGGQTWTPPLVPSNANFSVVRFTDIGWGWALDAERNVWASVDGGDHWDQVGALPGRIG